MKKFLGKNFLLQSAAAQKLYHEHAKEMPVIDYHCHLSPEQIANDINFENITQDGCTAIITNGVQCVPTVLMKVI